MAGSAPVLSTPAEHILEESFPVAVESSNSRLSEEELYVQYEIQRTIHEIQSAKRKRIALQFPDAMLVDAPRVFERLRDGLRDARIRIRREQDVSHDDAKLDDVTAKIEDLSLNIGTINAEELDEKLCILADTSYGACCVDEVAAEHVDADVVVHYGRTCLSPTARLPVIYVYTSKTLDIDAVVDCFKSTCDKNEKVCLMADIPYDHHLAALRDRLDGEGYQQIFRTEIVKDPSSLVPNRTVPPEVSDTPELLQEYSIFHISSPPTSLLLILSSRIKNMYIYPTDNATLKPASAALEASTAQLLRRRYALVTRLSTVSIFGILINTLSVSNYMAALKHCQDLISQAGKKSYVFVVGKVNAAKVANFSEIGGWVVIGCWESSLIESADFYRPLITPFELEVALTDDKNRIWGGEWIGDFSSLLGRERQPRGEDDQSHIHEESSSENWDDQPSDDEPPEFDLHTGKYVSHTRPMRRQPPAAISRDTAVNGSSARPEASALVQRARGDMATVGGQVSPAAEFLRAKRTWQGLGSDHEIAYERDDQGRVVGAEMEEGRSGIAKGYTVGQEDTTR